MYEIKRNAHILNDGAKIITYSREVCGCNILEVEAGTNGYHGGDSGHGSRTYFKIRDGACTDIEPNLIFNRFGRYEGFEVTLGGDSELETMIEALKFITKVLEEEAEGVQN